MMQLFTEPGTAYTLFWLALAGVGGIYLGKISVFGIRIGIAGVLFSGLLLGALG
jgi:putative transport protein